MTVSGRPSTSSRLARELFADPRRLPGVRARSSRWGGAPSLWAGRREIAHLHRDGTLDVRLTRRSIRDRRTALEAAPGVTLGDRRSEWVTLRLGSRAELEFARELLSAALLANVEAH